MAEITAKIHEQQLFCFPDPAPLCRLDSPAWFAWLETAAAFRYCSQRCRNIHRGCGPQYAPVSFRKERRRQGWLWYAYRRAYRVLYKRYAGKSSDLTAARLEQIARQLNEV